MDKGYSPALREAMKDIEAVMRKHDIGGFVTLQNKTHAEFRFFVDIPTWSNVRWLKDEKGFHLKLHAKSDKQNTDATVGMLYSIKDLCALAFGQMDKVSNQIEQQVKVEHIPFGGKGINTEGLE